MNHFIERCECGIVINQCRCISPDKEQLVIKPCTHKKETVVLNKEEFKHVDEAVALYHIACQVHKELDTKIKETEATAAHVYEQYENLKQQIKDLQQARQDAYTKKHSLGSALLKVAGT